MISEAIVLSYVLKLIGALTAFLATTFALWVLDRLNGLKFSKWVHDADDNAKSVYYAGRFIGISILFGLILL